METKFRFFCCMENSCGKEYLTKQNLRRHFEIVHLRKKESECEICHKRFINSANLKEHYFIHSNLKPHNCSVCGESFRHKTKLSSHRKIHFSLETLAMIEEMQ